MLKAVFSLMMSWGLLGAMFALPVVFSHGSWQFKAMFLVVPAFALFLAGVGINKVILWMYSRADASVRAKLLKIDNHWGVAEPFLALVRSRVGSLRTNTGDD